MRAHSNTSVRTYTHVHTHCPSHIENDNVSEDDADMCVSLGVQVCLSFWVDRVVGQQHRGTGAIVVA
jgi:hypothetical protein